jgi:RNA polymerase sigma-70 factor (ECF subfamily)
VGPLDPPDADLVERVLQGHKDSFRPLFERYSVAVYGLSLAMLGDHHDAQDIAQATFVAAFRGLHGYDRSRRFRGWILGIARNLCCDALAERPRERPVGIGLEELEGLDERTKARSKLHSGQEEDDKVLRSKLGLLPEDKRVVLALRYLEGLSREEIATKLGISIDAVAQRIYRGLKELRRLLPGDSRIRPDPEAPRQEI